MLAVLGGLTTIGGRLLGVRLSWWRALIAAGPGFVAGLIFVWAVSGRQHGPQQLSVPAILAAALIATMMLTVLLELLARPGKLAGVQGGLASIPHPVRSRSAGPAAPAATRRSPGSPRGTAWPPTWAVAGRPPPQPGGTAWRTACAARWRRPVASSSSSASCCRPARICSHRT